MKRKLKLTITKIRRETLAEKRVIFQIFCPVCQCEVETITVAESIEILEIDKPMFDGLISTGKLHQISTASGSLRICKNSLFQ